MPAILIFACVFAAAFFSIDHRLNAPLDWKESELIDFERVKRRTVHGTPRRRISFLLLLAVSVLAMWALPLRVGLQPRLLVVLAAAWLVWECFSAIWSVNARLTLRRLPPWIITVAVGLVVGAGLGVEGSVLLIALICSAFLIAGIGNEFFHGPLDLQSGYRFAGTLHPNQQACNCVMLAFSFCWLGSTGRIPATLAIICMVAGVAGLGLTRSRTGFWAAEVAALTWSALTLWSSSRMWPLGLAAGMFAAGMAASRLPGASEGNAAGLVSTLFLFGRTRYVNSLNGRTFLWQVILPGTARHWILGQGFGAFWDVGRLENIQEGTGLVVWACHSTPIEVFVRSGIIGTALFAGTSVATLMAAFSSHGAGGPFLVSLFVFVFLEGLVESFFSLPGFSSLFVFLLLGGLAAG